MFSGEDDELDTLEKNTKKGDVLTTKFNENKRDKNKSLAFTTVFGSTTGTAMANGLSYDFNITEVAFDGEQLHGDSMNTFLILVGSAYTKIVEIKNKSDVWVMLWAYYPGRQGRVHYHRGFWAQLDISGMLFSSVEDDVRVEARR